MNPTQRMLAFFCAMSLTFGITSLDFNEPEYAHNKMAYFMLVLGGILLTAFTVSKIRN